MGARTAIVLGVVGMLVGVVLADGPRDSETGLGLTMGLVVLALSVWHARSWGLGKLVGIGVLTLGGIMIHLADFGNGEWVWNQGRAGDDLAGNWVVIASGVLVLVASAWSLLEGVAASGDRSEDVGVSLAFWRKWWMPVVVVVAIAWVVGTLTSGTDDSSLDDENEDVEIPDVAIPDEWSVVAHLSDDGGSYRDVHMITTLGTVDEVDVEDLGGRLVWPDAELALCGVGVVSAVDGAVQIGGYFPNTEQCEPAMVEAFEEHGLPETGCLHVRVDGVDDEHCAPLTVDESEIEGP